MNLQFMVLFLVLTLILMFLNLKHWSTLKRGMRRLYFLLYAMTFGLYAAVLLGYKIPMPTQFFIAHVSPWMFSLIHG